MEKISRRNMIKAAGAAVAGASLIGVDAFAGQSTGTKAAQTGKRKKVLVIGAHPDDPESCAGGTILKMLAAGFDVKVLS